MDIFIEEDRRLMQNHCHAKGMSILHNRQGEAYIKEAVAYLSFAIIASGMVVLSFFLVLDNAKSKGVSERMFLDFKK